MKNILIIIFLAGCETNAAGLRTTFSSTQTATNSDTSSLTDTKTGTGSVTASDTSTKTHVDTLTVTDTGTGTGTGTSTSTQGVTDTKTASQTLTQSDTNTVSQTASDTNTNSSTSSNTSTQTATNTYYTVTNVSTASQTSTAITTSLVGVVDTCSPLANAQGKIVAFPMCEDYGAYDITKYSGCSFTTIDHSNGTCNDIVPLTNNLNGYWNDKTCSYWASFQSFTKAEICQVNLGCGYCKIFCGECN